MPVGLTTEIIMELFERGAAEQGEVVQVDEHTQRGVATIHHEKAWAYNPALMLPVPTTKDDQKRHKRIGLKPPIQYVCSDHYQVAIFDAETPDGFPDMIHLSIKRRDRKPLDHNRWRILQALKNIVVGEENEAVEIYPAESRLVDTANQYHLWVLKDPNLFFPFGFADRLVSNTAAGEGEQRAGTNYSDVDEARLNDLTSRFYEDMP
jgi:hypothetical protein